MDWSEIREEAKRFENLMASHLLKLVHFLYDYGGYRTNLNFLRNVDKKEVDFLATFLPEIRKGSQLTCPLF